MTERMLTVVSAGLRQPSSTRLLADRLAAATVHALQEQQVGVTERVVEVRDHAHAVTDHLLTGFPSADLQATLDDVVRADGLIVVSPIFSASYSGLFKSFFDVLDPGSLTGKPVLLGATGGTARHSLALEHALRPMFSYLRAVVVPTAVYAASEDWGANEGSGSGLVGRIDRAAGELAQLMVQQPSFGPVDEFADPTPFVQLLGD